MTPSVKTAELLLQFLKDNPQQRFCQALWNLRINQWENDKVNEKGEKISYALRDPYNDHDDAVLLRAERGLAHLQNEVGSV